MGPGGGKQNQHTSFQEKSDFFRGGPHIMWHEGSLIPHQGPNLWLLQWKHRVLTTGLPENGFFSHHSPRKVFPKEELPIKNTDMLLNCLYFILESRKDRCHSCLDFTRNTIAITNKIEECT